MYSLFKNIFLAFIFVFALSSCSEYNKVLNKGETAERFTLANKLYKEGKYSKAIRLYELITYQYNGKPQKEVITYRLADACFQTEDYLTSIFYFDKLLDNYPKSTKIKEALFYKAESYYYLSPKYSVDQADTNQALLAYQIFIDANPNETVLITKANGRIKELNHKLEKKAFETANQYYKIGYYKSAIVGFDNVILDHLGTSYKEEAMVLKFRASYELALKSVRDKKQDRIDSAIKNYERFKKSFPNSDELEEVTYYYDKLIKLKEQTS